jgi:plasmid stabilization system protein ParE
MPLASAIVPELDDPKYRQLIVHSYRIILRVAEAEVEVVTVLHGARDVRSILSDEISNR